MSIDIGKITRALDVIGGNVTVQDVMTQAEFFIRLVGGHANAVDILNEAEAIRAKAVQDEIAMAEADRVAQEPNP